MKNCGYILLGLYLVVVLFGFTGKNKPLSFEIPSGWPAPVYDFSKNPVTENGFQLGRRLFYDPILSCDSTISCASCHLQATGFAHVDHNLSHGIDGRIGTRNAPALMNLAWQSGFMWDGGVNHLDMQPVSPITSHDEMDETMAHVVQKLNKSPRYRRMFAAAFDGDSVITGQHLLLTLAQFQVMLVSANSKYDKHLRGEADGTFTAQEERGLVIFRKNCASCHAEPLFTTGGFADNGLPVDTALKDTGRMRITGNATDSLLFKIPTLRNIQFTPPYMHDGRFRKLRDVVNHYTSGISQNGTADIRLRKPIVLTPEEKVDLVAFLFTLTDQEFLFDPRFSFPR